jgi:hypothetical protein
MGDVVSYQLTEGIATIAMDDGKANALSLAMLSATCSWLSGDTLRPVASH